MPTLQSILDDAVRQLAGVTESPRLDAELLICHALSLTRASFLMMKNDEVDLPNSFAPMLERRLNSEPIAYILAEWEFFSIPLAIRPPTLIPRPETEHLVEAALELLPPHRTRVFEIGTGSGCIPIAIAKNAPECQIIATDIQPGNLALAQENADRHGLEDSITFIEGDLFEPVSGQRETFDIMCSNPPYVATTDEHLLSPDIRNFEDPAALYAGVDGLDIIRAIIQDAPPFIKPGGHLILEIGIHQRDRVSVLLEDHGFDRISFRNDLAGIPRVAIGRKPN